MKTSRTVQPFVGTLSWLSAVIPQVQIAPFQEVHAQCWIGCRRNSASSLVRRFCAELRNQLEAAQTSLYLSQSLEENCRKIESANVLSQLLDQGKLQTPIHLCGDNKGVFMAVSAQNPKTPAEPILIAHAKALR